MTIAITLFLFTCILAAANGANDVSKGIATLVGSGVSDYHRAVIWGSIVTLAGCIAAAFASQALVATFSGKGILQMPVTDPRFLLAVAGGAIGWLIIATRTGLPVSTTHSLTGALVGAGLVKAGMSGITWQTLGAKVALPLLASPVMSLLLLLAILPLLRPLFRRVERYCLCVEETTWVTPEGATFKSMPHLEVAPTSCSTAVARVTPINTLHWLSSGATSFFRGLNDTPKILALGVGVAATLGIGSFGFYLIVAVAMTLGSLIAGFRVTRTLAEKVTPISHENGVAANLATSILVGLASRFTLPVSTTHVSSGAIIGVGISRGGKEIRWKTVGEMLLAWVVTLPVAGVLSAIACKLLTNG